MLIPEARQQANRSLHNREVKKASAKGRGLQTISGMQPCFHPMKYFPHNFIVSRGWEMGKQPMDSLSLVPLPDRSSEGVGGEDGVGRYPYALVQVQSFSDEPGVMPKKKSRCSMPGPPPLMTYPSLNRATKYLCVRLTRPACTGGTSQPGSTGLRLECPGTARTTQGRRNQLRAVT